MSLANTLAVSGAARSLVLLGDPQQLEQPQKGSHPDGVGVSALEHVLGGAATMPPDRGLFLPTTWRLHPAICAFTSEVFYEGKLEPKPGLERQRLTGTGAFDGAGLWWVPVDHDGNQNVSMEEVAAVERIVKILLGKVGQGFSPAWTDEDGTSRPLLPTDLLVVAPYNAQVNRLTERLAARGVPVGTVDRVPRAGSAGRDLLDGHVAAGGRPAGDGVPLQSQSAECGDVESALRRHRRRVAAATGTRVSNAETDAARKRALSVSRACDGAAEDQRVCCVDRVTCVGPAGRNETISRR